MSDVEQIDKTEKRSRKKKQKFDFDKNARTIFVGNLPKDLTQADIIKIFKDCGPIESARIRSIVPEKETLGPKVALLANKIHPKVDSFNAYVVFKENESDTCLTKALSLNGKDINGHCIRVDRASQPNSRRLTLASRKKSVFVGNLRFDIREDELIRHFKEKVGPVNYVRLIRDSATGMGKGFGFVVFEERASAKKALELNDTKLKGRQMRVTRVQEDEKKKTPATGDKKVFKPKTKNNNNTKPITQKKIKLKKGK